MSLSSRDYALIGTGTAFTLLVLYIALSRTGRTLSPPVTDENQVTPFHGINALTLIEGVRVFGDNCPRYEWRWPNYDEDYNTSLIKLPCRYPIASGQNMSAILHHGWDPMMLPSKHDSAWMERPPSEVVI